MKKLLWSVSAVGALTPVTASADQWNVSVKVTMVEASHVPKILYFTVDQRVGNCPAGTYLSWQPEGDTDVQKAANEQTVYATLLTAKITGQRIRIVGDMSNCQAYLLYVEG